MHPLLTRQLKKLGLLQDSLPENPGGWGEFLRAVDRSYEEADGDRKMLEHSLEIVSKEMNALYDDLKKKSDDLITQEKNKLYAIMGTVPGTVALVSKNLEYIGVNPLFSESFGLNPAQFAGKPVGSLDPHGE